MEQYLFIQQCPPCTQCEQVAKQATTLFLDTRFRRHALSSTERVYMHGRRIKVSKRALRSDAGTKGVRKTYAMVKRHRRVRALGSIAGQHNPGQHSHQTCARVEVPASDETRCEIEMPMSPPRKKRANKSSSQGRALPPFSPA